jgi:hypothetical protein
MFVRLTMAALCAVVLSVASSAQSSWRSSLYPKYWKPGYQNAQGKFVHDFSYAGYKQGMVTLPRPLSPIFNVVNQFGADNSGQSNTVGALQAAIDFAEAQGGGVVFLPAGKYRCNSALKVNKSGVIIRGSGPGTTLFFTNHSGMSGKSHMLFSGSVQTGSDLYLTQNGANLAHHVYVQNANSLKVGDDIQIGWRISGAFVAEHGMSGVWSQFNGQWRGFFRREVTAIDKTKTPHKVSFDVPLRYTAKTRDNASIRKVTGHLEECGLEDLSISNAVSWNNAWTQSNVHAIEFEDAKNCWVREVRSVVSPSGQGGSYHLQSGGVIVRDSKNVTVTKVTMERAQNRGGGGAGYLFEVMRSNEVLIKHSVAKRGRHNFILNWDFGNSGVVFWKCHSEDSQIFSSKTSGGTNAYSEFHHSLAMACLVDRCTLDDGWVGGNRGTMSSGAGHTVTQSVFWNTRGTGKIQSWQYGDGYIIGTEGIAVTTQPGPSLSNGAAPADLVQGKNQGFELLPKSLYKNQLTRRKR